MLEEQPELIAEHTVWMDGEYLVTFNSKQCLDGNGSFNLYSKSYRDSEGRTKFGEGLKNRVVYIVHTLSKSLSPQDLEMRLCYIADTAKYNGAEAVVLIAYTLDHSAQERGVWDRDHPRMQSEATLKKFDGQAPLARTFLRTLAASGVDAIITPHNHCPEDTRRNIERVNEEFEPLYERAKTLNSNFRYHMKFMHVDLAPMLGYYVSDLSEKDIEFDISDKGRNIFFVSPDEGGLPFVQDVRRFSGLTNSAIGSMKKRRGAGGGIEELTLDYLEGLDEERGIEGMYVLVLDDAIRSGETAEKNLSALLYGATQFKGIELRRDPRIKGTPKKLVFYATRTNFASNSIKILSSPTIDDLIVTNADPRGYVGKGQLDRKTQFPWINFMLAEAAMCLEQGINPDDILTPNYIREKRLLKVDFPHAHKLLRMEKIDRNRPL